MLTKRALFIILLLIGFIINSTGQEKYLTESSTHIFWQPERQLTKSDFQGNGTDNPKCLKYCENHDLCTSAFVGLFAVLDIPKKKGKRGKLIEKAYFAPAFEKHTSYILNNDTAGIKKQEVVFDIYELSARFARKQLNHFQDSIPGYGITTIMFKTVQSRANEMQTSLIDNYSQDLYINKRKGAYKEWREKINELLYDSREFATTPEDCYRFIINEPIESDYVKAKKIVGNLDE